jgi:tetratricopeptide (TPR) repeat protein
VVGLLTTLVSALRDMGDLSAARMLFEQALEIDRRALGPEHPTVAITLSNLANVMARSGAMDEALPIYRKAYSTLVTAYGPEHPLSRAVRANLDEAASEPHTPLQNS